MARYACNKTTGRCDLDPQGKYSDWNLCGANCNPGERALTSVSDSATISITIKHDSSGLFGGAPVTCTLVRIDESHSNPKAKWKEMGSPKYMNDVEIESLRNASALSEEEPVQVQRLDPESSVVSFDMPAISAVRVLLSSRKPLQGKDQFV